MQKQDHTSVLCVSHGAAISYFLYCIEPNTNIKHLENCHILEFEYDDAFHLTNQYIPKNG